MKCDVCGLLVDYANGGKRWGSIRGDENGVQSVRTCSDACRDSAKGKELVADYNTREDQTAHPLRHLSRTPRQKLTKLDRIAKLKREIAALETEITSEI